MLRILKFFILEAYQIYHVLHLGEGEGEERINGGLQKKQGREGKERRIRNIIESRFRGMNIVINLLVKYC